MDSAQLIKAFSATVQASVHGLESLEPLLQREQAALTGKDPQLLEQIARDKLALLKEIEYSVQARDRLQKAAGLPTGNEAAAQLIGKLNQPGLSADWQRLTEIGRRVAELNDRTGQLVNQRQRASRAALEILTGRTNHEDTYSTLRRRRGGVASYSLGKV